MINSKSAIQHKVRDYRIYPKTEGLIVTAIVFAVMFISAYFIEYHALEAQKNEIAEGLIRTAAVTSTLLDGDTHKIFQSRNQEDSEVYLNTLKPLAKVLRANKQIKFVYTAILKEDGKVYFILDPTPAGDNDKDGVDDKSHIMDLYDDASPALIRALKERVSAVSDPYTDDWGTFISGYVPFYDNKGEFIGVVGVDLEISRYLDRLKPIKRATTRAIVSAFFLSILAGLSVWFLRNFAYQINRSRLAIMEDLKKVIK